MWVWWNGVLSSLYTQTREFFQGEEEILSRDTKAWILPDQVQANQPCPLMKFWLFPLLCSFSQKKCELLVLCQQQSPITNNLQPNLVFHILLTLAPALFI